MFHYTGQFKKKVTFSRVYNEVTSEPTIKRYTTVVRKTLIVCLYVIDAGKFFGPPPPGKTVLQNGDSTEKGVLYPTRSPLAAVVRNTFPRQFTNKL
jgi:hypothetical protein